MSRKPGFPIKTFGNDGKVYLVGAGPGAADLITKRGHDLLRRAEVIVLDDLVDPTVVRPFSKARIVRAGKRGPGAESGPVVRLSQERINKLLVKFSKAGRRIVRLKGGDPFVFGRGWEELEHLKAAGIPCEIVPGVSAATGAPTAAGIPLTDRRFSSQVTFITGHEGQGAPGIDWKKLSPRGTLGIFMGVSRWPSLRRKLAAAGWPAAKAVAAIEWGATTRQRVLLTTLAESAEAFRRQKLVAPALILVGDVARLGRPLLGKRIVVTRAYDKNEDLAARLAEKGAEVISSPAIRVEPLHRVRLNSREKFDQLLFLSANAIRALRSSSKDFLRRLKKIPVFAVGPKTASEAERAGWRVKKVAKDFNSRGLLRILGDVRGTKFLIPRVEGGPQAFITALRKRGAQVKELSVYRTFPVRPTPSARREILRGVDAVTFTSASTVRFFLQGFSARERRAIFRRALALSIGPMTSAALRQAGLRRLRQAYPATVEGLVQTLLRCLS